MRRESSKSLQTIYAKENSNLFWESVMITNDIIEITNRVPEEEFEKRASRFLDAFKNAPDRLDLAKCMINIARAKRAK